MRPPAVMYWPATDTAASHARAWMRNLLGDVDGIDIEDVALVTSELVTNAHEHSTAGQSPDGKVRLTATCGPKRLRVEVTDEGGKKIPAPRCPDADDLGGRGLVIVDALADDWGHCPDPETGGRTVWFEMVRREGPGPDDLPRGERTPEPSGPCYLG
ncbi:ATP-binding protein [Actinomadura nitritigenes]|uniref:ATP-binding protein n=1 Tax=Actinomadura nitritigenes TaxID=134602 RepID=UPI003D8CD7F7